MSTAASTAAPLRRALRGRAPGLRVERNLWSSGADVVAGVDEVGRGSWAGPLTVAAVVANPNTRIYKVRDSKMLNASEREALHDRILAWARAVSVGHATVAECTELGMADAQRLAARRAVDGLGLRVDHVLVDGSWDFLSPQPDSDGGCRFRRCRWPRGHHDRAGRRVEPVHSGRVGGGQGHPRPSHGRRRPALSRLLVRVQQGLSVPPPHRRAWRHGDRAPSTAADGCSWTICAGPACRA